MCNYRYKGIKSPFYVNKVVYKNKRMTPVFIGHPPIGTFVQGHNYNIALDSLQFLKFKVTSGKKIVLTKKGLTTKKNTGHDQHCCEY